MNQEPRSTAKQPVLKVGNRVIVLQGAYRDLRGKVSQVFARKRIYKLRVRISPWTEHWVTLPFDAVARFRGPEPALDPSRLIDALNQRSTENPSPTPTPNERPGPMSTPDILLQFLKALQTHTDQPLTSKEILALRTPAEVKRGDESRMTAACKRVCTMINTPNPGQLSSTLNDLCRQQATWPDKPGRLILIRGVRNGVFTWKAGYSDTTKQMPDPLTITLPPTLVAKLDLARIHKSPIKELPSLPEFTLSFIEAQADRAVEDLIHCLESQRDETENILERLKRAVGKTSPRSP